MGEARRLPSEAEIAVLEALAAQGETLVAAKAADGAAIRTRLLVVDSQRRFIVLASGGSREADADILARSRVELLAEWGEWRIAFAAKSPEAIVHEAASAIRLQFPETVTISRRRMHERAAIPGHAPLRCVAYSGASVILDAAIVDVSHGGLGLQVDSTGDALQPGMILAGCRIERPGCQPIIVDLEVRHTAVTQRPDGSRSVRAGCRFLNLAPAAMALASEYISAGTAVR